MPRSCGCGADLRIDCAARKGFDVARPECLDVPGVAEALGLQLNGVPSVSNPAGAKRLRSIRADQVAMRSIQWLDRPQIQRAAFHLIAGAKGCGKGTWSARVVASMTTGVYGDPRNVLIVSTEDSASIDVTPRLKAAGADLSRVEIVVDHFGLPHDLHLLQQLATDVGDVGVLIVDPLSNHMGTQDSNAETAVRYAIGGLNRMADELDCAILGVRHIGKSRMNGALASVLGSTAWVDLPRAVLAFAKDDEDEMVFHVQVVAGNRSGRTAAHAYRIDLVDVGLDEPVTCAVPIGESRKDVDALLMTAPRSSKSAGARELILDVLEHEGEQESDTFDARIADETGLSAKTVRNLRGELKNEGLVKAVPLRDEMGSITQWNIARTAAPRPAEKVA